MPRTEQQFEEMRASRQEMIMKVAMDLFSEEGFYPVSISRIAEKAGISKGLMYNYFKSKDELLKAIVYKGLKELSDNFDPNHDGILEHHELINFINSSCTMIKENIQFWKLYFSIVLQPSVFKLVGKDLVTLFHGMQEMLKAYFKRQGYDDPETETYLLLGVIDGIGYHYISDPENYPLTKVKDKLLEKYEKLRSI